MDNNIDDIQKRLDELKASSKQSLTDKIADYNALIKQQAANENQGALNSYNAYVAPQGIQAQSTDPLTASNEATARSAYLNRLAKTNELEKANAAAGDYYKAYIDAADSTANANLNRLRYNDAVNNETAEYQKQREAVSDAQWQKEYDATVNAYEQAAKAARSGSYGGYDITDSITGKGHRPQEATSELSGAAKIKYLYEQANAVTNNGQKQVSPSVSGDIIRQARDAGAGTDVIWDLINKFGLQG